VARAVELLYRITPPSSALDEYRDRFLERYGREREVPVLELLHPERGLGPVEAASPPPVERRTRALADLVTRAARERRLEVELDDRDIEELDGGQPWEEAPASVEVLATVAARSADDLDRGLFRVLLSFGQTYPAAGRSLGRFADLLGDDGIAALRRSAAAEARVLPGRLWAELVYAPRGGACGERRGSVPGPRARDRRDQRAGRSGGVRRPAERARRRAPGRALHGPLAGRGK
jgi:lantibiotic biosynthesis protein